MSYYGYFETFDRFLENNVQMYNCVQWVGLDPFLKSRIEGHRVCICLLNFIHRRHYSNKACHKARLRLPKVILGLALFKIVKSNVLWNIKSVRPTSRGSSHEYITLHHSYRILCKSAIEIKLLLFIIIKRVMVMVMMMVCGGDDDDNDDEDFCCIEE